LEWHENFLVEMWKTTWRLAQAVVPHLRKALVMPFRQLVSDLC